MMRSLLQDLRYGVRVLFKSPGFTAMTVLTLALGIGANATIFSLVNAVLLRPLPVADSQQVMSVYATRPDGTRSARFSYADYKDYRDRNDVFSGLVAANLTPITLGTGEQSEPVLGETVSGNYFQILGVRMAFGRAFLPEEERRGDERVVVVSHDFWRRRFGSAQDLLGQTLHLNGDQFTVVGIADKEFTGTSLGPSIDLWVPAEQTLAWLGPDWSANRSNAQFRLTGRLKPDVTREQAEAQMNIILGQLAAAYPELHQGKGIELLPASLLEGRRRTAVTAFSAILLVMVGLVLLVACANVANLLLARAVGRRREIAIRQALGASRLRLIRQLMTESVLLALTGGAAGLLVSAWASNLLFRFNPLPTFPLHVDLSIDMRVLAFSLLVSLATGVVLGLVPAFQGSGVDLVTTLKDEAGSLAGGTRKSRLRSLFIVVQVALSLVLLVGAGLLVRSLARMQAVNPGFNPANMLAMDFDLDLKGMSAEQGTRFYQAMLERIEAVPGVTGVALANRAPLDISTPTTGVQLEGFEPPPGKPSLQISFYRVSPKYFQTLSIPLMRGRDFSRQDSEGAAPVVIINETMASRFWPGEDPTGKQLRLAPEKTRDGREMKARTLEIIGVARDSKYRSLSEEATPHIYLPFYQDYEAGMTLLVRTSGDPKLMFATVRRELQALDKDPQGFFARTMFEHMEVSLAPGRIAATLFALFGGLALVLASVGIYGVISYSVTQRTHEIGIRMALGAQVRDILGLIIGQGMLLTLIGIGLGLIASFALTRFLSNLLFGVSATDPLTFITVAAVLAAVALLACYVPARRAIKVDPMEALRYE
jgi:predicted permease